jgi:Predicted membrane protein (DUF2207)
MIRRLGSALALATVAAGLAAYLVGPGSSAAQEDWVITNFGATYVIAENGTFGVTEEIAVDFGMLERHGIFRDIPIEYRYDEDSNRLIEITGISVTDGSAPVPFETSDEGANLRIKIGDPDEFVSGQQRYVISYTVNDGLNPFDDHDELFWNVTGGDWEVSIERATANVTAPGPGIERITCFEGETGSTNPCQSSFDETSASFEAGGALPPGSELTLVVGLAKGLVEVGPPVIVPRRVDPSPSVGTPGTPEDEGNTLRDSGSDSGGGVSAVLLFGVAAGLALGGASIAVVAMLLVRRRFFRY